ncbi:MAG: ABC transporter substrate-binding protein [Planctomycetota bacterium]
MPLLILPKFITVNLKKAISCLVFLSAALLCLLCSACDQKEGGTEKDAVVLNQRLSSKIQTLDPADVTDAPTSGVCSEFHECLYAYHYLKRPYTLIPNLAAEMPTVSEDGKLYRIPVRRDVYFHDDPVFPQGKGRGLTAHDFVYAWKRIANTKVRCKNWWIFNGKIVGLDAFREYTKTCKKGEVDYSRRVEGLYAEDDYTIIIKLHHPWPQLVFWLAHLPTAPMAKEAVDIYGLDIVRHPVGTGAYVLKRWRRGVYIEAVRNPNYRRVLYPSEGMPEDTQTGLLADAGKPLPFIDRVIWRVLEEDQPRWLLFMKGDIDITGIPKDNFGQAISFGSELTDEMKERDIQLVTCGEPVTFWVGMNMNDPVISKNKALRYAISHSIDRERFIELLMNGRGHPGYGLVPPVMDGYDESIKQSSSSYYDPEKAREYLKKSHDVHGGQIPRLRLAMSGTSTTHRQMGQFLKRNMEAIGLTIEVEFYDWPTYLEKLRKSDHQLYHSGWIADYPDAENFLQVFYSKNIPNPNHSNYKNPEFDALFEQASTMQDCPERTALYRKAEQILVSDMPCAFTYHRIGYILRHDWLENVKLDAYHPDTTGFGYLKYYRVDAEKRKQYRKTF